MKLVAIILALFLAACAAPAPHVKEPGRTSETLNKDGTKTTTTESDTAVQNKLISDIVARPLVKITCPPAGCVLLGFEVTQPIQGQLKDLLYQAPVAPPELSPAAQVTREIFQPLKDVALVLGPAAFLYKGVTDVFTTFGKTASEIAGKIQAPAGTSIAINNSSGVGVLGGNGSTSDRHDLTVNDRHDSVVNDSSDRSSLSLLCNFYQQSSAAGAQIPAYCNTSR